MHLFRIRSFRLVVIGTVISLLYACANSGDGATKATEVNLDDRFPLMANDHPPGASAVAMATARAMGRGVNFGNMLEPPHEGDWGLTVQDEFFTKAKEAGFKNIRLPVRWSNHTDEDAPYLINPNFVARVESVVDKALAGGFYVMLNVHHYRQLDGDNVDSGEFEVEPEVLELRFLTMWEQIAARFKNKSDHLLFEIYNEPHGRLTNAKWNDLAARALKVIRNTNPNRIVVIGSTLWNKADALKQLRLPNDPNLIVTIHNYDPMDFTHQGAEWSSPRRPTGVTCCSDTQKAVIVSSLDEAKAWSDANRYPIFLGEFGAYNKADMRSRATFTRFMRDEAERRNMSWAYWEFASGFGVYDPGNHVWRSDLLNALTGS